MALWAVWAEGGVSQFFADSQKVILCGMPAVEQSCLGVHSPVWASQKEIELLESGSKGFGVQPRGSVANLH